MFLGAVDFFFFPLVHEICQSTSSGGQAVSVSRCLSHPGTSSFSRQELTASTVFPSVVAMRMGLCLRRKADSVECPAKPSVTSDTSWEWIAI